MATKDASLYGIPRPKKLSGKEISSSTTLAFTTQLSSLISASSSASSTSNGKPAKSKSLNRDIFATHNKNSRKRALADVADDDDVNDGSGRSRSAFAQKHSEKSDAVDAATWRRVQRKMEDKARLYAALKRGDVEDGADKHLVDFDRKWADKEDAGGSSSEDEEEDDNNGDDGEEGGKGTGMVEYVDEFGRTRTVTAAAAAREKRRLAALASDAPDRFTARPVAPETIIRGDVVQSDAFDIDRNTANSMRMAELAAKREAGHTDFTTPPPETHFDASKEVRTKGVGFFQFSGDEETRKVQMEELERERVETEERRKEVDRRKEERRKVLEERKRVIGERRSKAQVDRFLDGLGGEIAAAAGKGKEEDEKGSDDAEK